ncbi:MAG: hypothetical protein OXN25_01485 [Candidatus Poribacteria bacterium]|nr:hypothetical protein [Candidatus Poribacteria bacterium]
MLKGNTRGWSDRQRVNALRKPQCQTLVGVGIQICRRLTLSETGEVYR